MITTNSNHKFPEASIVLNREFTADRPNQKCVADITYVPTDAGWLYVAGVLDLFSRKIVGWDMSSQIDASLVESLENGLIPTSAGKRIAASLRPGSSICKPQDL